MPLKSLLPLNLILFYFQYQLGYWLLTILVNKLKSSIYYLYNNEKIEFLTQRYQEHFLLY